jgi:hypothetical protein
MSTITIPTATATATAPATPTTTAPAATTPATTTTTTTTTARRRGSLASVTKLTALATLVGAAATEAFGLVARALDVPMRAADPGASAAKAIPVGGLFMAVLLNAAVGFVLVLALARWARRPARTYAVVAAAYAALSLLAPVFAAHTTTATKVVLMVAHVIPAVVIIPPVTKRLAAARR